MQAIAFLKLVKDVIAGNQVRWHLRDGLMGPRIKRLAHALNGPHPELTKGAGQLFQGKIHTLDQCRTASLVVCRLNGSFHVVDDREEFLQQLFVSELDLLTLVPLGQALIVFELGRQSKVFFVEGFTFIFLGGKDHLHPAILTCISGASVL